MSNQPKILAFAGSSPIVSKGKVAAFLSASSGGLGGIRGLVHVRAILEGIGVFVIPEQKAIPDAGEGFDESGQLNDEKQA